VRDVDVAIIGAGPYGLSLAAHLKALGVDHQVFGTPMSFWRNCTPPGMELKSEGSSCDLSDPCGAFSIKRYYKEMDRSFAGRVIVPAELFIRYGMEFQRRFAPGVDRRNVASVSRSGDRFVLRLEDGSQLRAARVVVATGLRDYAHVPNALSGLPNDYATHSGEYGPVDHLSGRKVLVIGGGASAVDLAWSLHERASDVALVCRKSKINFHPEPPPRKWHSAIRTPDSPIGGGWNLWFYARAPHLFRLLPEKTRLRIVATVLGPFPGWFMTKRVPGRIPILGGLEVTGAEVVGSQVRLTTKDPSDRSAKTLTVDHVIAATGYRVDVNRLTFLDDSLKKRIRTSAGYPALSGHFESSEPGLYFVGVASAATFGPVMRFVAGADFTVSNLSRRLASRRGLPESPSASSEFGLARRGG